MEDILYNAMVGDEVEGEDSLHSAFVNFMRAYMESMKKDRKQVLGKLSNIERYLGNSYKPSPS